MADGPRTGADAVLMHLRQTAAVPSGHEVVDGALRLVVALARATVGGADGASVSLHRHGRLLTVAATDRTVYEMDAGQYLTGQGPCLSASTEGRWFYSASLEDEVRWPAFVPRARGLGINAVLSNPLVTQDQPVGALNLYSRSPQAFTDADRRLAALIAAESSTVLSEAGITASDDRLALRLTHALQARQVIAQAQGVIMERHGIDPDAAYHHLLDFSRSSHLTLLRRAGDVVASSQHRRTVVGPVPDGAA